MTRFIRHTEDSAPEAAKPLLAQSKAAFGFIPNLYAVMAEAPGLLEAYQRVHELFAASSFSADEKTVVWQSINVENACHYCVPAHTGIARSMQVNDAIIDALRDGDDKLYVFLNALAYGKYLEDKAGTLAKAAENWPAMHRVAVEEVNG